MPGEDAPPQPVAGWYPQPDGSQRYWNGVAWSERRSMGTPTDGPPRGPDAGALDIVVAAGIPILGLIWGLLDLKKKPRAAWQIIIASVVGFVIWSLILNGTL